MNSLEAAAKRKKILIADDLELNKFVLRKLLESRGCMVDEANNGSEALQYLKTNPYDFAIIDFTMPDINGIELIRKCRIEETFQVPIFVITTDQSPNIKEKILDAGAQEVLERPLTLDKLDVMLGE